MLYSVIQYLNILPYGADERGLVQSVEKRAFKIENGQLLLDAVRPGQYIVIEGSAVNDGAYQYPTHSLIDEEFTGTVYVLRINRQFSSLIAEMEQWAAEKESVVNGAFKSESFNGYSYTRESDKSGVGAVFDHFAAQLKRWRKI